MNFNELLKQECTNREDAAHVVINIASSVLEYINSPDGLEQIREACGLTQVELAEIVGIRQPNISAMERGRLPITHRTTQRIVLGLAWYLRKPTTEEIAETRRRVASVMDVVFPTPEEWANE